MAPEIPKNESNTLQNDLLARVTAAAEAQAKKFAVPAEPAKSDSLVVPKTTGSEVLASKEPMKDIDTTKMKGMRRRAGKKLKPAPALSSVNHNDGENKAISAKPEPKALPKTELTPAELEDEQVRAFVESIPDGEVIILVSQNGKKEYYRRDGEHLEGKNDSNIKTIQAWKRYRDGWKMEKEPKKIVSRPTAPVPDVGTPADVPDTQKDDFASGKVFAEEYLELNPPGGLREADLPPIPTVETKVTDVDYDLAECREGETLYYFSKNDNKGYALKYRGGGEYTLMYPTGSHTVNELYVRRHVLDDWKRVSEIDAKEEEKSIPAVGEKKSVESKQKEKAREKDDVIHVDDDEKEELEELDNEEVFEDGTPEADEVRRAFGLETRKKEETEKKEETLYLKIERLTSEVNELRSKWVEEDVKRTTAWKKFKSLLGINKEEEKGEWQKLYEEKELELQKAEMAMMKGNMAGEGTELSSEDMTKGSEKLLHYYKIEERVNLIEERTQYRAKNQNISERLYDLVASLGRDYNSIPLKRKLMYAGILSGLTIATTISGGAAAGALASVVVARRVAAGLGTAVGTEAVLESVQSRHQISKAEKEIAYQMRAIEKIGDTDLNLRLGMLDMFLKEDIVSLDEKLQNEKRAKTWRKLGAAGVGTLVGSGWLTRIVMEHGGNEAVHYTMNHLGGNQVLEWGKEQWGDITGGTTAVQPGSRLSTGKISGLPVTPEKEIPTVPSQPETAPQRWGGAIDKDFGGPESPADAGGATQSAPEVTETPKAPVPPSVPEVGALDLKPDSIGAIVSQDITVGKGESLWKIIDQNLANQTDLEGPQRTHFIDAVKDKYGDVLLKEGEVINFSAHGIDKEFIEQAWADAKAITPEQALSIDANDAKIAEFAKAHPEVTLTNESVDTILQGDETETPSANEISDGDARDGGTTTFVGANEDDLKHADIQPDRDIVLGKAYDLKNYTDYFKKYPEAFVQFKKIGETYMEFSFQGDQDIMNAIGGKTFAELDSSPSASFDAFIDKAREAYGSKYGLPQPKEKVYEYIARIAMLGIEHPTGKLIRFPQSV